MDSIELNEMKTQESDDDHLNVWATVKHGANTFKSKTQDAAEKAREKAHVVAVKAKHMSVFGAAPSLKTMKNLNQLGKNMFMCAEFWYSFRKYYPFFAPASFTIGLFCAIFFWNTPSGHMLIAALLSFLSCVAVMSSFIMILPWRRHPSTIVFYRAASNMLFSFLAMCMAIAYDNDPQGTCTGYAASMEFSIIAGDFWLTTVALDLVLSLTNPFTSYKENMRRYHTISWSFALIMSFALYNHPSCQSRFEGGFCWVNSTSCLVGYYIFWIICMYVYQFGAIVFAYMRLSKGLPATFRVRLKIAVETFKCLALYFIYVFIIAVFLVVLSSRKTQSDGDLKGEGWSNFRKVFLFFVCSRGFVDGVVWFTLHEFASDEKAEIEKLPTTDDGDDEENQRYDSNTGEEDVGDVVEGKGPRLRHRSTSFSNPNLSTFKSKSAITGIADAIGEIVDITTLNSFDEGDLSPQVNVALREQIVRYVTMGITQSAAGGGPLGTVINNPLSKAWDTIFESIQNIFTKKDPRLVNLQVMEFLLENEHPFKAYAQDIFRDIREVEGVTEASYLKALQRTEKEQLSEGASGAFMFFCGGGDFIVKTIKATEADVLHRSLEMYRNYLMKNSNSLLVRFLGSYSLKIYAQTFHFVVMRNIFEPGVDINERFDIKGSWVNRSANPPMPNKRVACRHCNEMFTPSAREVCTKIVGVHEANVVLKDNDLRVKISLRSNDACALLEVIKKDSDLLAEMGVLDYSLIIGIKKRNFEITHDGSTGGGGGGGNGSRPLSLNLNASNVSTSNSTTNKKKYSAYKAKSVAGAAVYYMGIVDFLQDWSMRKKMERASKIYITRSDPLGVSVMEPIPYRDRFQDKMDRIFDIQGEDLDGSSYRVSHRENKTSTIPEYPVSGGGSSNSGNTGRINAHSEVKPSPTCVGIGDSKESENDVVNILHTQAHDA